MIRLVRVALALALLLVSMAERAGAQASAWEPVAGAPPWLLAQMEVTAVSTEVLSGHTRFRINIPGVAENGQPDAYWTSKVSIRCAARHPTRRYTVVLHGSNGALVDARFPQYPGWTLIYPGTLSGYEFDFICPVKPL